MKTITLLLSPYHTGLRDHRVGNGPSRILSQGLIQTLSTQEGIPIETLEIPRVDTFEGEIGRSFEVMRRTSLAVNEIVARGSYPVILSGNCMATAAVACGLELFHQQEQQNQTKVEPEEQKQKLGFIYFDSHDDLDSPDVNENGYFDAMGLSMLRGESWKMLMSSVPGYNPSMPFNYHASQNRFLYCGLRDQSEVQRERVVEAGMEVVWGDVNFNANVNETGGGGGKGRPDFRAQMEERLNERPFGPVVVHWDLDVMDADAVGKVNDYPSPGGMLEEEIVGCLEMVPKKSIPRALVVCQFDPDSGDGDRIAQIAIRGIRGFVRSLVEMGVLERSA